MFKKVLIANRGEIACRIARACREMGISTVAVYSQADENSPHIQAASEAICIGASQSIHSYLNMEAILQAALQRDCQAIHPGYGFLSENSIFASLCEQYKITFIGPDPGVILKMGNKSIARDTMSQAGIPIVPGSQHIHPQNIEAEAQRIGYPVLLKAAHGGGGKGMRICRSSGQLTEFYQQASLEAQKSFGNASLYMEKYIENGRHIEFQVLADSYGNVVHLGERECSIQRNHQKLIEESPSPIVSTALRQEIGAKVTQAMKKIAYKNAGTVEFFMDRQQQLYFLEMNTRLQVEHPVTEMVTGIDIVKEQLKIAANHALSFTQEQIAFQGHAIECRINAEDPSQDFRPSPGCIESLTLPATSRNLRIETHIRQGYQIPPFYDSMIAKIIVHEPTREEAMDAMIAALEQVSIQGVASTISLHLEILKSSAFRSGNYDTKFIEQWQKSGL